MSKECHCEEGLPEWIMSYADMVTILMAFFVVMYSMLGASTDEAKEERVLQSLRDRFGPNWAHFVSLGLGPAPQRNPAANNSPLLQSINAHGGQEKKDKSSKGKHSSRTPQGDHPRVHTLRPGEQAAVGGIIYFTEGSSKITKQHQKQIEVAAAEVGGKPQKIEIRGHSSRRPLPPGSPHRDNWDLAYARCRNVMEGLIALGIDPSRIILGVAGENEPLKQGSETVNRNQNSRVEVFMLDEVAEAMLDSPTSAEPTAPGGGDSRANAAAVPAGKQE